MYQNSDFIHSSEMGSVQDGSTTWTSPSNIALVKYWGKYDPQLPANPSISFTLKNCHTKTKLSYAPAESLTFEVYVDGERNLGFEPKIEKFLNRISEYCPYLNKLSLRIDTTNTFPHSSGIASSASGMSALSCCIMSIEKSITPEISDTFFKAKASFLSRLGSGSAARSIYPVMASWGATDSLTNSSDLVATEFTEAHPIFKDYQDTVLLVDKGQKKVSSTVGHNLMNDHPYAKARFEQAHTNISKLKEVLKNGDLKEFIHIVELEALTLHGMMLTSSPYFILMKPNTLQIIEKIWEYREQTGSSCCFTLDAGANVHFLYPKSEVDKIMPFIKDELSPLCEKGHYICDEVGFGAQRLD